MNTNDKKPGPDPERLNIEDGDDWQEAVKKALQKERPPEGWPETDEKKESNSDGT